MISSTFALDTNTPKNLPFRAPWYYYYYIVWFIDEIYSNLLNKYLWSVRLGCHVGLFSILWTMNILHQHPNKISVIDTQCEQPTDKKMQISNRSNIAMMTLNCKECEWINEWNLLHKISICKLKGHIKYYNRAT